MKAPALKGKIPRTYVGPSGLGVFLMAVTQGDALRACPWLSYHAPSALQIL